MRYCFVLFFKSVILLVASYVVLASSTEVLNVSPLVAFSLCSQLHSKLLHSNVIDHHSVPKMSVRLQLEKILGAVYLRAILLLEHCAKLILHHGILCLISFSAK